MIIFLYGKDTYRSSAHLKKMVDKFKADRDPQGLNVAVLDADREKAPDIMTQILSIPFLSERRMVVIKNLLTSSKHKDFLPEILERLKNNDYPDSNVLLFWEDTDKFKTKNAKELFTLLSKEKFAQSFHEMQGAELNGWIKSEVAERGGKISAHAISSLVANIGPDTWLLSSTIDQLLAYKGSGEEIATADVELFIEEKVDDNIFNLVDALVAGQKKQVYKMIRRQYEKGEDAGYVFAMILRQFRILLEMRDVYDREPDINSNNLASKLNLHPFVARKSLPFVKRYSSEKLRDIYNVLLEIDIQTKTGQGDQSFLLDVFVGTIQ